MKHQGKGYTIEIADVKPSDKPQRMMPPIKVSMQTFFLPKEEPVNERKSDGWDEMVMAGEVSHGFRIHMCKSCPNVIRISDTTCPHCGEGQ